MKKIFTFKSIQMRIIAGFSLVIALVILLGAYNYYAVNKTNKDTKEIINEQLTLLIGDQKLALNMVERTALIRGYLLYGDTIQGYFR